MDKLLEIEYTRTRDGIELALGRYRCEGGQPVILAHGLALNHTIWDFPISGHSFAHYLRDRGYDVWLACFRGHGNDFLASEKCPKWEWNLDDLAVYDVPAIVDKVIDASGRKPFWVGHSMGGVVVYMYLQGADYCKRVIGKKYITHKHGLQIPYEVYGKCAYGVPELTTERHGKIRGLVAVGTPINMAWSHSPSWRKLFRQEFWDTNFVFPFLSRSKRLRSYIANTKYLPLSTTLSLIKRGPWLQNRVHRLAAGYAFSLFWYPPNMNPELVAGLLDTTLNDVCGKVLDQFADWTENQTFRAFPRGEEIPYVYSENFSQIHTPLLVITGRNDKIANAEVVYRHGFLAMGSSDKQYRCFERFGHNDLCIGIRAPREIFPYVEQWLRQRSEANL